MVVRPGGRTQTPRAVLHGEGAAAPSRGGRGTHAQAVAKRPGSPIDPPKNVLITFCGLHDMFSEHFWLSLSCFGTS
eukprot:6916503-Pyramimonas_sp.AAC.1